MQNTHGSMTITIEKTDHYKQNWLDLPFSDKNLIENSEPGLLHGQCNESPVLGVCTKCL